MVTLSWGAANPNGAPLSGYQITWKVTDGDGSAGSRTVGGNELSAGIADLRNGTTYVFTIAAANAVGVGPSADSPPARPSSDVPGAPGSVSAAADSSGAVQVSWQAADGEGRKITGYTVLAKGADGSTVNAGQASSTKTTVAAGVLELGTTYTFGVTAANDLGLSGEQSAPSNSVTPYRPADAPGSAKATGTDRTVALTWAAPELNGGTLVGYEVSGDGVATKTVMTTSATFIGLDNGTRHTFAIVAKTHQKGQSAPVVDSPPAQVSSTPGRTATVDVVSARSSGDRQISFTLSVNDFGSGAVTCHVTFDGAERWAGGCAGTAEFTVGNLAYATTYTVAASASNGFGTGPQGGAAQARTNDPPPPPPVVTVSKGPKKTIAGCTVAACALVHVSMRNFGPGKFTVSCQNASGTFWTYQANANSDTETCVYGYPGTDVWVVVNGVRSNTITW